MLNIWNSLYDLPQDEIWYYRTLITFGNISTAFVTWRYSLQDRPVWNWGVSIPKYFINIISQKSGIGWFFFQFSWQVPTFKMVAICGINLERKIQQKKKLRNISCMFLNITANKLSLKQTGRHSEVLLKQEAGEHEKPYKECWNT